MRLGHLYGHYSAHARWWRGDSLTLETHIEN